MQSLDDLASPGVSLLHCFSAAWPGRIGGMLETTSPSRGAGAEVATQAIFARRQLVHGASLSQRTFRLRQTTQLRSLGVGSDLDAGGSGDTNDIALFSGTEAELVAPALPDVKTLPAGPCDMLGSNDALFLLEKFNYNVS